MRVKFTIPMMPPRECSANFRGHWWDRAQAGKDWRETARMAALVDDGVHGIPDPGAWDTVVLDIEVEWCCGRKRMDDDNLIAACKPARDGIADALWGGEDRHVRVGDVTQRKGAGVTIVTLRQGDA